MTRIELIYFRDCPHVEEARENLRRAIAASGRHLCWTELDLDSAGIPPHVRHLPSPSILVDGADVSGATPAGNGRACRMGGPPSAERILAALRAAD